MWDSKAGKSLTTQTKGMNDEKYKKLKKLRLKYLDLPGLRGKVVVIRFNLEFSKIERAQMKKDGKCPGEWVAAVVLGQEINENGVASTMNSVVSSKNDWDMMIKHRGEFDQTCGQLFYIIDLIKCSKHHDLAILPYSIETPF